MLETHESGLAGAVVAFTVFADNFFAGAVFLLVTGHLYSGPSFFSLATTFFGEICLSFCAAGGEDLEHLFALLLVHFVESLELFCGLIT